MLMLKSGPENHGFHQKGCAASHGPKLLVAEVSSLKHKPKGHCFWWLMCFYCFFCGCFFWLMWFPFLWCCFLLLILSKGLILMFENIVVYIVGMRQDQGNHRLIETTTTPLPLAQALYQLHHADHSYHQQHPGACLCRPGDAMLTLGFQQGFCCL